jgi:hypothetical protein
MRVKENQNINLMRLSEEYLESVFSTKQLLLFFSSSKLAKKVPSNRVNSSLEGKFGTVGDTFVLVLEPLFMKISNLCKNHLLMA